MALSLDPVTGCLPSPPVLHDAAAGELWDAFVTPFPDSNTRPMIRSAYESHRGRWVRLLAPPPWEQWIDGGFTTAKLDPHDIDFVTFLPVEALTSLTPEERAEVSRLFRGPATPPGEPCHAFVVPVAKAGTPEMTTTMALRAFFPEWFGTARPDEGGHAKGIVRLWIGEERP